jgi:hypothetical protein
MTKSHPSPRRRLRHLLRQLRLHRLTQHLLRRSRLRLPHPSRQRPLLHLLHR